jgi:hypothetical protein
VKRLVLFAAFALTACGPEADPGPRVPLELYVSAGLLDQISGFQLSLVTDGTSLDCFEVQKRCIKDQVAASRFVKMKDAMGRDVQSVTFPIALVNGMPNTQDLSLTGIPTGSNYALVVEAVSTDSTPRLSGSSCNYVKTLGAGTNAAVFAKIELLNPAAACDPRH